MVSRDHEIFTFLNAKKPGSRIAAGAPQIRSQEPAPEPRAGSGAASPADYIQYCEMTDTSPSASKPHYFPDRLEIHTFSLQTGAFAVFLLPQKNADGKFTEFFEPLGSRKALRRFNLSGNVCDFPYNYTQNGYRHIYSIGSHVRYGAKEVVNVGGLKCGDVLQSKDIATLPNSTLTPSVQRLLNRCWTSKGDETCVRDEGGNGTVLVNRYHPILHLNGITVYSHCCRNKICGKIPDRCAYFVYDQASGVDFYIDDQLNWTADAKKDPLVLIPLISGDDEFVKKRRYSFFPANPAQSPAPVPIPAPLNCSSGFNFNFGAFLGKFPKFSFGNFSFFNFSRFPFLKIGPRNMKGLQGLNGLGNLANLSSLVKH
uniref:Uncharacterized protein n=1 Tax=Bursaphelenchus xylophilus TaxID=6326 RepID=A0A1I7RQL1_BURXY